MPIHENLPFELEADERVLWSGAPRKGLVFGASDVLQLVIGLFILYLVVTRLRLLSFSDPIEIIIACVIVLAALYFSIGRFFFDAYRRKKSVYALTSERMLIRESVFSDFVKSLPLNTITDTVLREQRNGFGSIWIQRRYLSVGFQDPRLMPTQGHPLGFAMIPDASHVYELLEAARLTRPAPTLQSLLEKRSP